MTATPAMDTRVFEGVDVPHAALVEPLRAAIAFDYLVVAGRRGAAMGHGTLLWTSWPRARQHEYLERGLYLADPVVKALALSRGEVGPEDVAAVAASDRMFAANVAFRRAHGMPWPSAIAIREGSHCIGVVSLGRAAGLTEAEWAIFRGVAPALHRHHARLAARASVKAAGLTPMEIACLARAAEGRNARETGQDLGICRRIVASHLAAATARLGAANRIEAVALAMRAGLFD